MNALILGAGFSTRLYPLTEFFPKGLLDIGGKAILQYVLDDILSCGISNITVVTNHRYFEAFNDWKEREYKEKEIVLLDDGVDTPEHRLGAVRDMCFAIEKQNLQDDDLLVVASDTLTSLHMQEFLAFFASHRGVVNAVYSVSDISSITGKLGCVVLENNRIVEFIEKPEKPKSTYTSIPYYIFPKESIASIFQYAKVGVALDAPGSLISWMVGKIPVFGYDIGNGYYYDVATKETYDMLKKDVQKFV